MAMTNFSTARTPEHWAAMKTMNSGESLAEMTDQQPVLLVFLRHFGCSFCREAIDDIARKRAEFEQIGVRVVMVHMAPQRAVAERFFKKYQLFPVDHISDPDKRFYHAFGLGRGTPGQLFGLMNWIRGFQAGVIEGHGFAYQGVEIGDGFQMPGVFVVYKGEVKNSFVHRKAWDRPDYSEIISQCQF